MFPLHKPPSVKAVMVAVGISLTVAGIAHGGLLARGQKPMTMSADWVNANKEYMKFNNMNPMFGISRDNK